MRLTFYPVNPNIPTWTAPIPATECLPDYWKAIPTPTRQKATFNDAGLMNSNVRACAPYQDALTAGYIQRSACDIYINSADDSLTYHVSTHDIPSMKHRNESALAPYMPNTYPIEFVWQTLWNPQTPRGYSILITHPLNRYDLPFITTSGIVDSDEFLLGSSGQVPFYIRKGFTGLIPAGTPILQYVPIKRDDWNKVLEDKPKSGNDTLLILRRYFTGGYRRLFWQRKRYT